MINGRSTPVLLTTVTAISCDSRFHRTIFPQLCSSRILRK